MSAISSATTGHRRSLLPAGAFLLLACLLAMPTQAAGRDARILGTVEDETGERLEGVRVTVSLADGGESVASEETNRKGRFSVIVADGTAAYVVRLQKDGYRTFEEPLQLKPGQAITRIWTLTSGDDGVQASPEVAEAYGHGIDALRTGDLGDARDAFESALTMDPEFVPARQGLLLALLNLGEWQAGRELAEGLLSEAPSDPLALKGAFDACHELGDHQAAAQYLDRLTIVEQSPETAVRLHNQAVYEAQRGDRERGIRLLEQAIEMDPALGPAYLALATLHLDAEDYDQALSIADGLLEREPDNAEALSIRYEVFRRSGDREKARLALEELQAADPEPVGDAFFQQGVMLYEDNYLEAAINAFERVLSAAPDDPKAHFMLGKVLISHGDYEGALEHLKRFIELAPDDSDVAEAEELIAHLE